MKNKISEMWEGENSSLHKTFVGCICGHEVKFISSCCNAEMRLDGGVNENGLVAICLKCEKQCKQKIVRTKK